MQIIIIYSLKKQSYEKICFITIATNRPIIL